MWNISGAQLPSSVTSAQSLQYYTFRNKLVHDKPAKSHYRYILFIRYIAVKSRTLYRLVIYHKVSFFLLYAGKAIYIPPNFSRGYEMVTKSSENLLSLGHLHNHQVL